MSEVKQGLYYTESHEYVRVDGDYGYVGITDYAQQQLGNIVYVDMPEVDDEIAAGEEFGAVESVKAASDLNSPVTGVVEEVNEALEDAPDLINKDAYGNWIMKVKLSDKSELDGLMDAAAYDKYCQSL
ncbi:glycine cleavage system H protein [Hallella multisaccharivorax DSM 17128]|uniref:Glycine cleavage system H protein n=1 Tax=Hallella multisaccharivorax DSM 17128 TaxID=688246 RepID=F8NC64_9BACT|nr:glycine cleavage system protein GcvH [Hallella multisaccharivorax]EGN58035.1 Glycine cleavage system H protein [Hallella multisaccharivorax DSM 17128]GJG30688.1 glycine cleavage system H protein [Hallella multisaccharivorax DSM 17128]